MTTAAAVSNDPTPALPDDLSTGDLLSRIQETLDVLHGRSAQSPKGRGDLYVANQFRQQLKLTHGQLQDAVRCPFGAEEYREHLLGLGHIEED